MSWIWDTNTGIDGNHILAAAHQLGIVSYTNQEMAEEADKIAKVYHQKFEKFHGPLVEVPSLSSAIALSFHRIDEKRSNAPYSE
ncbi:hypothetical protein C1646_757581 [Rhizophagus diaphanus]|nr:hypothetical protein C1646_757581 [Rhizophagus diaphanus] [Rhizophagus sp. MUCL 43196]